MAEITIRQKIAFDRALTGKKTIIVCSGLLVLIYILGAIMGFGFGAIAVSNAAIFLILLISYWRADHYSSRYNLAILIAYLILTIAEFLSFGLPGLLLSPGEGISRGSLMDVLIIILPYFYIGLRIMMAIPLLMLFLITRNIEMGQKSRPSDR